MNIKPDAIALRTTDFYQSHDITVKTDKEVTISLHLITDICCLTNTLRSIMCHKTLSGLVG